MARRSGARKIDHILLMGHGGPRKREEVMPFLTSMTEGKNVSRERLDAVARNYEMTGGASPYHDAVTGFAKRLEKSLKDAGMDLPVFVGMKHWHPFFKDVLSGIHLKGHGKGLAIALNAFGGAAAGIGYRESLETARISLKAPALDYVFLKGWHGEKLFIEAQAEAVSEVFGTVPEKERNGTPILFSFHSLPVKAGPQERGSGYADEIRAASALVAKALGHDKWSVVYQSKPPVTGEPWLGPDIGAAIERLAKSGEKRVVVAPLGFLCDHVEILYDLDCKAKGTADKNGMEYLRAKTVIDQSKITRLLTGLIAAEV